MDAAPLLVGNFGMSALTEIRRHIQSPSEDARFHAWMTLYRSEPGAASELFQELERVIERHDPLLKIGFIRFLSKIDEDKAARLIVRFLGDANFQVFEAATKAFLDNPYKTKLFSLIPLIQHPSQRVVVFALDQLSMCRVEAALLPILDFIEKRHSIAKEVFYAALAALRHYPDSKIVPAIQSLMKDVEAQKDPEIRFRMVLVWGGLYRSGFAPNGKSIEIFLEDASAKVRKTALWALRGLSRKQPLDRLLEISLHDADPQVRMEALHGLAAFPEPRVILHLMRILMEDKSRLVALKAESVLRGLPPKILIHELREILVSASTSERNLRGRIVVFLAEFDSGSLWLSRYLKSEIERVSGFSEKETVPLLEASGLLEAPDAIEFLEGYLRHSPVLSYVALKSILKLSRSGEDYSRLVLHLGKQPFNSLHGQMILSFLSKIPLTQKLSTSTLDVLTRTLFALIHDQNTNVRYLSFKILGQLHVKESLLKILESYFGEPDPEVKEVINQCLSAYCMDALDDWCRWMRQAPDADSRRHLIRLFRCTRLNSLGDSFVDVIFGFWGQAELREDLTLLLMQQLSEGFLPWKCVSHYLDRNPYYREFLDIMKGSIDAFPTLMRSRWIPLENAKDYLEEMDELSDKARQSLFYLLSCMYGDEFTPLAVDIFDAHPNLALRETARDYLKSRMAAHD